MWCENRVCCWVKTTMRPTFIISLEIIAKCHYGNQEVCRVPGALGKAKKTLGKGFAECRHSANDTRRILVGKQTLPSVFCRALGEAFAECRKNTRQRYTLGKMKIRKKFKNNSKNFQKKNSGEAATPASARPSSSKSVNFLR